MPLPKQMSASFTLKHPTMPPDFSASMSKRPHIQARGGGDDEKEMNMSSSSTASTSGSSFSSPPVYVKRSRRLVSVLKKRRELEQPTTAVYGRENELKTLQNAFDRIRNGASSSAELVVIRGSSGSGKSSIVRALTEWCNTDRSDVDFLIGSGKYDQLETNEPFAAIVTASNQMCDKIARGGNDKITSFTDTLVELVGNSEDVRVLRNAIPGMKNLIADDVSVEQQFIHLSQAFTRLKQLWRSFIRSITTTADITIMFLDDLQWADSNSLDLINSLTTRADSLESSRLLLICAFRDDATVENSQKEALRWSLALDKHGKGDEPQPQQDEEPHDRSHPSTDPSKNGRLLPKTTLSITGLRKEGMNDLVEGLLFGSSSNPAKCRELSDVILNHTAGNPFFALLYLDYLTTLNLVRTQDDGESWQWDIELIKNQEDVPDSIPDLLGKIIGKIPEDMRRTLVKAAHIGHQFSGSILEQGALTDDELIPTSILRLSEHSSNPVLRERTWAALAAAVNEGLLERKGMHEYVFPHDQIQNSLYALLSDKPKEQAALHLKIGSTLLRLIEEKMEQQMQDQQFSDPGSIETFGTHAGPCVSDRDFFVAIDNLNQGSVLIKDGQERIELVQLNFQASQRALRRSAFVGALEYARSGISLLESDRWSSHYVLCLDLYSHAARLEYCTGNFVRSNILIAEIHQNAHTIIDQLPAFFTEIDVLQTRGEVREAHKLGVQVVRKLGEPLALRPGVFHVLWEYLLAARAMKRARRTGFLNLPPVTDPAKVAIMTVLRSITMSSSLIGQESMFSYGVAILRIARLCCRYGISEYLPFGVTAFASVQGSMGSPSDAYETATVAMELIDHIDGAHAMAARIWVPVHGLISPWCGKPLVSVHEEFIRSYHVGMAHGDIEYAYFGVVNHCCIALFRGSPLKDLEADCRKYVQEMEEFQVNVQKWLVVSYWQTILALLGWADRFDAADTQFVKGHIDEMKAQQIPESIPLADVGSLLMIKLVLGTLGHDTLREDERLLKFIGANAGVAHTHYIRIFNSLFYGLGSFELHRQTGKRKHRRNGLRALKEFTSWHKKGVTTATPLYLLLLAESRAITKKKKSRSVDPDVPSIEDSYLAAANAASGSGECLMIAAYSYERLASPDVNGGTQRRSYLKKAEDIYTQWGADAKVERIQASGGFA